jgi:hypothetical protein
MAEWIEAGVARPAQTFAPHEEILLAQNAHLACALVVATELAPRLRQAYLLGDALGVDHQTGAQICGCSEAAFRQRLSRARRAVREHIQRALNEVPMGDTGLQATADELDRLVRLGELAKVRAPDTDAAATERILRLAAPKLTHEAGRVAG